MASIRRHPTAPAAMVNGPLHQPELTFDDTQFHGTCQGNGITQGRCRAGVA